MPIFEFRCAQCGEVFEKLFMNADDKLDMTCPKCQSENIERVVSATNYAMGAGPGGNQPKLTSRTCGDANQCMTLDLPGPAK
ncbi:MAG: zinc ribbon domain-containing protein [Deltaproteobacteria bacterium]|nr:zinc ribbon domain-containing protein [Deltaproteobacteria bacterium]MCF8119640.1 zinc ribbon domain-containing protein [Deltaproteobacteria bacterium]